MKDNNPANRETNHGSQRCDQHQAVTQVKDIGEDGGDGADQAQHIEPHRSADWTTNVMPQPQLEEQGCKSDGRDNDQGQRAEKSSAAGVENNERKGDQEQTSGEDGPTAGFDHSGRIGSAVGQGVQPQVIQGRAQGFKY